MAMFFNAMTPFSFKVHSSYQPRSALAKASLLLLTTALSSLPMLANAQITTSQLANGTNIVLDQPVSIIGGEYSSTYRCQLCAINGGVITATTNDIVIETTGITNSISAQKGGKVILDGTGGRLNISGSSSNKIFIEDNSVVDLTGAVLTHTGTGYVVQMQPGEFHLKNSEVNFSNLGMNLNISDGATSILDNVTFNGVGTPYRILYLSGLGDLEARNLALNMNRTSNGSGTILIEIVGRGSYTLTGIDVTVNLSASATFGSGVVFSSSASAVTTVDNITLKGNGVSYAFFASNGATITAQQVTYDTSFTKATAIIAGSGGTVQVTDGTFTLSGLGSTGASSSYNARNSVVLTDVDITLTAGASYDSGGGYAFNVDSGGGVTVDNSNIIVNTLASQAGTGAFVRDTSGVAANSRVELTNSSLAVNAGYARYITDPRVFSYGAFVTGVGAEFISTDSSITTTRTNTTGNYGVTGVQVEAGGAATLSNTVVTTNSDYSPGFVAKGAGSTISTLAGTALTTKGSNSFALTVQDGASVNLTDSAVEAQGVNSNGLVSSGAGTVNNVNLTNTSLASPASIAIVGVSGTGNVTLDNSIVTGNGTLLNVANGAAVLVTANNGSIVNGLTTKGATGTSGINLNSSSIWNITGASQLSTLSFDNGVLHYEAVAPLIITDAVTLNAGGGTFDTNGYNNTLDGRVTGVGALTKIGLGELRLLTTNDYTGDTLVAEGTLTLTGAGAIASDGRVDIASGAIFNIDRTTGNSGNYTFSNELTGAGRLQVELIDVSNEFNFTVSAGTAFKGTVALGSSTFLLSDDNTDALVDATLEVGSGNTTTVGLGTQVIGGLTFNGGTIIFDAQPPASNVANTIIETTKTLDVSKTGIVQVNVPDDFSVEPPTLDTSLSLMEQDVQNLLVQLVKVTGTVSGTAGSLVLADLDGNRITNDQLIDLENVVGGPVVARAHYDYRLTVGEENNGLYISYGLTQVDLIGTGTNALVLSPRVGAIGAAADLSALITGTGDLAIVTHADDYISLSNLLNSYTGMTDVRAGNLIFGNDHVLGETNSLNLASGTSVDMAGFSQQVGALRTSLDSRITISGTLTINDGLRLDPQDPDGGSVEVNTLFGNGTLVIDPSILHVNGVQLGYTGLVSITGGSTLMMNAADAFNSAQEINIATASDTLIFGDESSYNSAWTAIANGTMSVPLSGLGTMIVQDGSDIALSGNNTGFSGRFDIADASFLRVSSAAHLGRASVEDNGSFVVTATSDWALTNTVTGSGIVIKDGTAALRADQSLSVFTGETRVVAGKLQFGDAVSGGVIGGDVVVSTSAGLEGNGRIAGTLTNSGTVTLSGVAVGNHLVVTHYVGDRGTLILHTALGDDTSVSDRLVIDGGTATGTTRLAIRNQDGLGAQTTGNGILVVEAINGARTTLDNADPSQSQTFSLSGRVAAGAYDYQLYSGGNASTGGNVADQNWYLRSYTTDPGPNPGPSPEPVLRPEVPTNTVILPLALDYGYALLDTLHQRSGSALYLKAPVSEDRVVRCADPRQAKNCTVKAPVSVQDQQRWAGSGWARLIGNRGFRDADSFAKRGPDYDYTFGGVQAGLDVYGREQADGTVDKAGIYVGYGQIASTVKGQPGAYYGGKAGSVDMNAYTVGAYWTHLSARGWYTDAVVQGTWYSADARSVSGQQIKPDGFGILASLEGGYRFALGRGWSVEPQAQLVYQSVSFDNAKDAFGHFKFEDGDSLRGRLGLRVVKDVVLSENGSSPRMLSFWGRANIWHEYYGSSKTIVTTLSNTNPVLLASRLGGTWAEIGAGVTAQVSDTMSLFATGAYQHSLDNRGRETWDGRLGMTLRW